MESISEELYNEVMLEIYKNPVNKLKLDNFNSKSRDVNTLCGDEIEIFLKVEGDKISEIGFQGQGCAISQVSASILTEMVKGKDIHEILKMEIDPVLEQAGISSLKKNHVRIKCAMLSLKVLKMAIYDFIEKRRD